MDRERGRGIWGFGSVRSLMVHRLQCCAPRGVWVACGVAVRFRLQVTAVLSLAVRSRHVGLVSSSVVGGEEVSMSGGAPRLLGLERVLSDTQRER